MSQLRQITRCWKAARDLGRYALSRKKAAPRATDAKALRDATRNGAVLIVDDLLPRPDRDAGSRILEQLLRTLVEMGLRVYFLPAETDAAAEYADRATALGVTVLDSPCSKEDWRQLQTLAGRVDFIWLCRPLVAVRYFNFFRAHSTAQILYYTVDLHYLREERHYRVSRRWVHLLRSKIFRAIEYSVIEHADAVVSLSSEELKLLARRFARPKLRLAPPHVARPDRELRPISARSEDNYELIFVGNFRHTPNADAIRWFLDAIWPIVRATAPQAQLNIVGAALPAWLQAEATAGVRLLDSVSDCELHETYRRSTLAIAPLRFGAGIKGKVLEAMEQGVPIVSTGIGLEGLPELDALPAACDKAETFAATILRLLADKRLASDVARRQREYLKRNFSPSAVREQLGNVLAGRPERLVSERASRRATPHSRRLDKSIA